MGGSILRKGEPMGLKQLFDTESSTYTYLIWDTATKDAIIVDPVDIQADRDVEAAKELGLNLVYGGTFIVYTMHVHDTPEHKLVRRRQRSRCETTLTEILVLFK